MSGAQAVKQPRRRGAVVGGTWVGVHGVKTKKPPGWAAPLAVNLMVAQMLLGDRPPRVCGAKKPANEKLKAAAKRFIGTEC